MKIIRHLCDLCILIVLTERRFPSLKYNKDNSKIAVMLNIVTEFGIKSVLLYCMHTLFVKYVNLVMNGLKQRERRGDLSSQNDFEYLFLYPVQCE